MRSSVNFSRSLFYLWDILNRKYETPLRKETVLEHSLNSIWTGTHMLSLWVLVYFKFTLNTIHPPLPVSNALCPSLTRKQTHPYWKNMVISMRLQICGEDICQVQVSWTLRRQIPFPFAEVFQVILLTLCIGPNAEFSRVKALIWVDAEFGHATWWHRSKWLVSWACCGSPWPHI